jgi:methylmalonyl-CoA/ethylmalonyl-CoA epimerase
MKSTIRRRGGRTSKTLGRRQLLVNTAGLAGCFVALGTYPSEETSAAGKPSAPQSGGKRLFTKVVQVAMVVNSVEASVRRYWDDLGVGPWKLYTLSPSNTSNMTLHGRPVQHSFRAALADIGDMEWELIEPLDNRSVYAEHLSKHGEGLHHIAFDVEDFVKVTEELKSKGYENVQSGRVFGNDTYVYFNLNRGLACTAELNSNQTAPSPQPDSTYP